MDRREQAFIDAFDIYSNTGVFELRRDVASARSNIYSVDEKDTAAYVQGDLKSELFGLPLRGDLGMRFVRTSHYQFSLEGQNLGDTYEHLYNDTTAQRNEYFRNFGRQYTAGFRYSF